MRELSDLLARVERATGADRELDARLYVKLIARFKMPTIERLISEREASHPGENVWLSGAREWPVLRYTASLDAALALVERVLPDLDPILWRFENQGWGTRLASREYGRTTVGQHFFAPTPALAILAALLKALQSSSQGGSVSTERSDGVRGQHLAEQYPPLALGGDSE